MQNNSFQWNLARAFTGTSVDKKPKSVSEFFYLNTFLMVASNRRRDVKLMVVEPGRSIERPIDWNKIKCWHTLRDWCFVVNTTQFFFSIKDRIWYPINSLECQSVVLPLTASDAL